jgi:hypothetical protein
MKITSLAMFGQVPPRIMVCFKLYLLNEPLSLTAFLTGRTSGVIVIPVAQRMRNLHSEVVPSAIRLTGPPRTATPFVSAEDTCLAKTEPTSARQQLNLESDVSSPDQSRTLAQSTDRRSLLINNGLRCSCRCLEQTRAFSVKSLIRSFSLASGILG